MFDMFALCSRFPNRVLLQAISSTLKNELLQNDVQFTHEGKPKFGTGIGFPHVFSGNPDLVVWLLDLDLKPCILWVNGCPLLYF